MHSPSKKLVHPVYMEKQDLYQLKAIVTKVGCSELNKKKYKWVQLNETIFHPQRGGQLSDTGTINGIPVVFVYKESLDKTRLDQFEILHCFEENEKLPFQEGDQVELVINKDTRDLHSKMHTAGHVLAETVKEFFPELEGYHGNHDPKNGYVRFKMLKDISYSKEEILSKVAPALNAKLKKDILVSVVKLPSGIRAIQIGESSMPCGGTHVHSLKEIGEVDLTDVSINLKERIVTVKYRLK